MADLDEDPVIDKAWSSVQPGDRVRWATPNFVKHGRVLSIAGRSATFVWDDERKQVLPDARWYFVEGKRDPNATEHLVILAPNAIPTAIPRPKIDAASSWMSTEQACEYLGWDPKKLRRFIRSNKILAQKQDDRWFINRERLQAEAAKQNWV